MYSYTLLFKFTLSFYCISSGRECPSSFINSTSLFSSKLTFTLINKQNCPYWAADNQKQLHQNPLYIANIAVWCGVSNEGIDGSKFFEAGNYCQGNSGFRTLCYNAKQFLGPQLEVLGIIMSEICFQQGGATAHTSNASRNKQFKKYFPQYLISRSAILVQFSTGLARSPNLSVCSFFLWGHFKYKVYSRKPRLVNDMKNL